MAYKCDLCGKKPLTGYKISHSHRKTKKRQKPNLRKVKVMIEGKIKKMRLCTKCLKKTKKVYI